jgi:hypothetical protein
MFGNKDKPRPPKKNAPVATFADTIIKSSLQGEWLTLALSKLETTFSTKTDYRQFDDPKAYGLVHFHYGCDRVIRCELHLSSEEEVKHDRIGWAAYDQIGIDGDSGQHVILRIFLPDPRRKIEEALHAAFDSAALSNNRFVHIAFRREKLEVDAVFADMQEKGDGYHPLTQISLIRQTILPQAPAWSWLWSRDE